MLPRGREREHAAVICLPRLRKVTSRIGVSVFRPWTRVLVGTRLGIIVWLDIVRTAAIVVPYAKTS
jgi:hypothetical protein